MDTDKGKVTLSTAPKERVMPNPLGFDVLKDILHRQTAALPDSRHKGPNTQYAIQDA